MEEQERRIIIAELRSLQTRGRLIVTPANKARIQAAMAPLPPPWEWENLRELVQHTATDMGKKTGFDASRIRFWERGFGTMDPRLWLDYATLLSDVVTEELRAREEESLLNRTNGMSVVLNPGVTAQIELLRSAMVSLTIWSSTNRGDGTPPCTPGEAVILNRAVRETVSTLRGVQHKLRIIARGTGTGGNNVD